MNSPQPSSPETAFWPEAPRDLLSGLRWLIWFTMLLGIVGLVVSKALLSISSVAFPILGLVYRLLERESPWRPAKRFIWPMAAFVLLSIWGFWLADDMGLWARDLKGKLPFLLWILGLAWQPRLSQGQQFVLFGGFVLTVTIVATISLGYAFADWGTVMEKIKRNGSVEIVAHISHIYFGVMLAFSIFLSFFLAQKSPPGAFFSWFWYIPATLNMISIHFLASRTGLLAGYGAAFLVAILYLWRSRRWKLGLAGLIFLITFPLLSYQYVPAFRTRVQVTMWDLQRFNQEVDLSHHSASLRLLAWQNAWQRFQMHPVFGVGISDVEQEMRLGYVAMQVDPDTADLPQNPHNQYLEYLLGWGLTGALMLIGVMAFILIRYPTRAIPLIFWAFWAILILGMMFESLLERQAGIAFFVIFSGLIPNWENSRS